MREWTEAKEARRSFVVGAARMRGWTADTPVSEAEFERALEAFRRRPLGG